VIYFNTSKVRLEVQAVTHPTLCGVYFNTSKVRLEGSGRRADRVAQGGFQYLKGAIGRRVQRDDVPDEVLFQYLKGAIGRPPSPSWRRALVQFQYLKGAIGRTSACPHIRKRRHFNTSKVRLEVVSATWASVTCGISIPQRCDWKKRSALHRHRKRLGNLVNLVLRREVARLREGHVLSPAPEETDVRVVLLVGVVMAQRRL